MNANGIDLRSDTVTRPGAAMRNAMAQAEVGDDVFGEDPTVNRLQESVAALLGKAAALFVPTGVMANQIAIKCHTQPGDEVIVEMNSHIFNYETAAPAVLSHVQLHPVRGERGILRTTQLAPAIRPNAYYMARSSLLCLENTHNRAGGTIYPLDEVKSIHSFVKAIGLKLHLDGARLWNACIATGNHPREYAQFFDSISVCFSKGLGAPVGSALVGSEETIQRARKYRKIFGGGMRQAGIIAAGALYAVEHNFERLKEDHLKARWLAERLSVIPKLKVDLDSVQTNIVIVDVGETGKSADDVLELLKSRGVMLTDASYSSIRAVTHLDVSMEEVKRAGEIIAHAFSE